MGGTKYSVGSSKRPNEIIGASPGKFYEVSGEIKQHTKGKTMGMMIEVPISKDKADFPSPDKYNAQLPNTARNIITYRGKRSEIKNTAV